MEFDHAKQIEADMRGLRWLMMSNVAIAVAMGCAMVGLASFGWSPLWALPILLLTTSGQVNVGAPPKTDN